MSAYDIDTTFGAAFIGLTTSAVLYGITLLQTYDYYKRYQHDAMMLKIIVGGLWIMDTLHLILCIRTIYWYLVTNFSDEANLDITTWSMAIQTDCNGIIGLIVECFFARRVWLMSKNWFITSIIVILSIIHFALGVVFTVESFNIGRFSLFGSLTWVTCVGLGGAAAADILIAASMCYYLSRKRTGIERTDSMVTTMMIYSFNTGLLTSIVATASVVTFAIMPVDFVWLSFFWILGKCYVNSFLASLNSRKALREKGRAPTVHLSRLRNDSGSYNYRGTRSELSRKSSQALAVTIETTTEYRSDFVDAAQPGDAQQHLGAVSHPIYANRAV